MKVKSYLSRLVCRLRYEKRRNSESYISYLRHGGIKIANSVIIRADSVAFSDILSGNVAVGNPTK